MKEEIGLLSIMDNLIVLENGERYSIEKYIDKLKKRIDKAIEYINTWDLDIDFILSIKPINNERYGHYDEEIINKLISILKGEDNDDN